METEEAATKGLGFHVFNGHEQVTSVRFAPAPAPHEDSPAIMATSNVGGHVKLYTIKPNDKALDTTVSLSEGDLKVQSTPAYNLELVHEFNDHFFPINDIQFCPHS
jgi:hypothetical protein